MAGDSLRKTHFPYCLQKQPDGRYLLLNRRYKPVGLTVTSWMEYDAFPVAFRLPGMRPATAAKLSVHGDPDVNTIYLYDDGTHPEIGASQLRAYLERLGHLLRLKTDLPHD